MEMRINSIWHVIVYRTVRDEKSCETSTNLTQVFFCYSSAPGKGSEEAGQTKGANSIDPLGYDNEPP